MQEVYEENCRLFISIQQQKSSYALPKLKEGYFYGSASCKNNKKHKSLFVKEALKNNNSVKKGSYDVMRKNSNKTYLSKKEKI